MSKGLFIGLIVLLLCVLMTAGIFYWYIEVFSSSSDHTEIDYIGVWQAKEIKKSPKSPLIEFWDKNNKTFFAIDDDLNMHTVVKTQNDEVLSYSVQEGFFRNGSVVYHAEESNQYGNLYTLGEIVEDNLVLAMYIDRDMVSDSIMCVKLDIDFDEIAPKDQKQPNDDTEVFNQNFEIETERFNDVSDMENNE